MIVIPIVSVLQWPFGSEGCHHCRVGKLLKGHRQSRFPIEYHRRRDDGVRKGRRKHWPIIQAGRDLWKQEDLSFSWTLVVGIDMCLTRVWELEAEAVHNEGRIRNERATRRWFTGRLPIQIYKFVYFETRKNTFE
ncbi:uncharacterized protein LOC114880306 isoform X2 [Osmia bicornis bicornis]|uniref:uncharacterized protein LOC114880306 isoform X2 n=1 Tax=Osmia bicornis bicornis TaxID=1437191 RepID=UPI001EAF7389|nr:uncharacterized protein LOC114880306 isoform X2 [Osmia bicornis bicornis]